MANPTDRLTKQMWRVLREAQREAQRWGQPEIRSEHMLLALLRVEQGKAAQILHNVGVTLPAVEQRVRQLTSRELVAFRDQPTLAQATKLLIELSVDEARLADDVHVGTEHLAAGLLRQGTGVAYQVLTDMGVDLEQVHAEMQRLPKEVSPQSTFRLRQLPREISPLFWLLVLITVAAGYASYQRWLLPEATVFAFVTGGWLLSLCLHEFAHALVGYVGGDTSVVDEGYLTLNPLKYTHGFLSIVLPLFYLFVGGLGLPGGAVYINRHAIRSKAMTALMSAAGPLATALCALSLLIPFLVTTRASHAEHTEFWAGVAMLAWLQVCALIFNLLPLPGLDGFGIISPYLPQEVTKAVRGLGNFTFVLIFILFTNGTVQQLFSTMLTFITAQFTLDQYLVSMGFYLFRFWAR